MPIKANLVLLVFASTFWGFETFMELISHLLFNRNTSKFIPGSLISGIIFNKPSINCRYKIIGSYYYLDLIGGWGFLTGVGLVFAGMRKYMPIKANLVLLVFASTFWGFFFDFYCPYPFDHLCILSTIAKQILKQIL